MSWKEDFLLRFSPRSNDTSGGGLILEKAKRGWFLMLEELAESVDFQSSWNPRGDGDSSPGSCSSASAASVPAYD